VLQTTATYAYSDSNWKDRLTSFNSIPLSYDAIGNLTYFDGRTFSWTAGRQLAGFELNTDDYAVSYKYNADGLRTQKYIDDDQTYTDTTYDYIWADGKLVSQTDGTDVLYFLYDSNDSPTGFVLNDAATYLYIKNLQGDITGIADENGAIIVNYTYDEWGKLLSLTDNSESGIIGALNPLRYRGYYYDTETGYYYLQSRYYNPSWGRFINADVIEQINGLSLFAYCDNSPVYRTDPSGYASYTASNKLTIPALPTFEDDKIPHYTHTFGDTIRFGFWKNANYFTPYPDGKLFFKHFINDGGVDLNYDYRKAFDNDPSIRNKVNEELAKMKDKARNTTKLFVYGESFTFVNCETTNWQLALGGHNIWLYGMVINGKLKYTVGAVDRYNFTCGKYFSFAGKRIYHDQFVKFATVEWAFYFTSYGTYTDEVNLF